jgi:spore germination protein YaaH
LTHALQEVDTQKKWLESIQIFAAYFDENDAPFLTERLGRWIDEESDAFMVQFFRDPQGSRIPVYLSVVNDIYNPNGSDFKNPDLVSRLLLNSETRAKHMAELLALVSRGPFDGLEIDYERVKREDWKPFLEFCENLSEELGKSGKMLRVVLEPQGKYYEAPFPEGPEYVIMAYNLFGGHSGPGPKADPDFIKRLASWAADLKVKPRLALATGGFIWEGEANGKNITESEAHLMYQREGIAPTRDPQSGYLVFQVPLQSKKSQTVWFADGETLAFLANVARESGFTDFALWSFSGNRRYSLNHWKNAVAK